MVMCLMIFVIFNYHNCWILSFCTKWRLETSVYKSLVKHFGKIFCSLAISSLIIFLMEMFCQTQHQQRKGSCWELFNHQNRCYFHIKYWLTLWSQSVNLYCMIQLCDLGINHSSFLGLNFLICPTAILAFPSKEYH